MGLFTLLVALGSTISDTIRERKEEQRILEEKHCYENIDFDNIAYVTFEGTETAYRIETEEEFDPVMTNFLTDRDGWQHYETQTVEYEVEDGENYCFTIVYNDGTEIYREFHETSPLTEKLLEYCNQNLNVLDEVIESLQDISKTLASDVSCENTEAYTQPKESFVVIDFETTGVNNNCYSPDMDEILSVSIINQDGEVLLNTLCNTERKKSWSNAQRVHRISPQDVQGYPTFSQILPQVLEILSSVDFVIAYNIVFEYGFVKSYIQITNPQYFSDYDINWAMHKDPMDMYAKHIGSRKWIKLSEAAKSFGYNFNPHDSLEDVKATLFLYNQLK